MAATARQVVKDAAVKATLAPELHAAVAKVTVARTAAQAATMLPATRAVDTVLVMGKGHPARQGHVPSSPTSVHIRATMSPIPMV